MPQQTSLGWLADTLLGAFLLMLILRILFQALRVDAYNPLVRGVLAFTAPPLRFLRRFIPGLYGIDLTPAALFALLALAKTALPLLLAGYAFRWSGALVFGIADALDTLVWVILLAVLARVVLSWIAPGAMHPAARLIEQVSEPVMSPFRRMLPAFGGLDFSPIVTIFALRLVQNWVLASLANWGARLM
ncbi:MAG: YggT family protein [Gammaproteobacteria bacterium]